MTTRTIALLAAASAAVLASLAAAAGASAAGPRPQTFALTFVSVAGSNKPIEVVARGAIDGFGTATEKIAEGKGDAEVIYTTFHLANGTLRLVEPNRGGFRVNTRTCTATIYGRGTWKIAGGTGAYAGATGGGRLTAGGTVFAQRSTTGACRGENTPERQTVFYRTMRLRGTVTMPSS